MPDHDLFAYGRKIQTEALPGGRITRIRSTPAALIGYVQAPDAEQAVKEAIARYGISNPQEQARLAAQRVKEIWLALYGARAALDNSFLAEAAGARWHAPRFRRRAFSLKSVPAKKTPGGEAL